MQTNEQRIEELNRFIENNQKTIDDLTSDLKMIRNDPDYSDEQVEDIEREIDDCHAMIYRFRKEIEEIEQDLK